MKKVLFAILALVLALGLALPMATPALADPGLLYSPSRYPATGYQEVAAGGSVFFTLTLSDTAPPGGCTYSLGLFAGLGSKHIPGGWISGDPSSFYEEAGPFTQNVTITITVPSDAYNGNYAVKLKYKTECGPGCNIYITVTGGAGPTATADVTFDQTGVGTDFTGTVLTIDEADYFVGDLPITITKNVGENISFEYHSPLVVDAGKQYVWTSTSGLSSDRSGSITVPDEGGSVTGNYKTQYLVTFDQTGLDNTANSTVVTVNGTPYGYATPHLFTIWVDASTGTVSYSYASTVTSSTDGKQFVLTGVTGPDSPITGLSGPVTVTGAYKTQFYLTLLTDPAGITTPTGAGWYDAGTSASISTTSPVVIAPYTYFFAGWTTTDMTEIANQWALSTTVLMDKAKTVTADYVRMIAATGGKTIGFWANKNGQALLTSGDATFLNTLAPYKTFTPYPKAPTGYPPFNTTPATFRSQVKGYLLNANAVDMKYMLAAQLLATELNVRHGFLDGTQEVWVDVNGDGVVQPGEVTAINSIMSDAIAKWSSGTRAEQEYVKNLLDKVNNNQLWFIVP